MNGWIYHQNTWIRLLRKCCLHNVFNHFSLLTLYTTYWEFNSEGKPAIYNRKSLYFFNSSNFKFRRDILWGRRSFTEKHSCYAMRVWKTKIVWNMIGLSFFVGGCVHRICQGINWLFVIIYSYIQSPFLFLLDREELESSFLSSH